MKSLTNFIIESVGSTVPTDLKQELMGDLKEFNGKLVSYKVSNKVVGAVVKFASYQDQQDFEKDHSDEWKFTTNTGNNYEMIYLNDAGEKKLQERK